MSKITVVKVGKNRTATNQLNGKSCEIINIFGYYFRIDMNGETVDTMIYGVKLAEKLARELIK